MQESQTVREQKQINQFIRKYKDNIPKQLLRQKHLKYMQSMLFNMGRAIIYFDYGQPWIYYYILNTYNLLGKQISKQIQQALIVSLKYCWNQQYGGFGGGYKQLPHLAPTYAAFLCILLIGKPAYHLLDRQGLTKFFYSCKKNNQFQMTNGAQFDLRGTYIVSIIAKLLKLDQKLLDGVAQTIIASQTYQGGLSNTIGGQAHGGYTFCGIAALSILNRLNQLDISRLLLWLSRRQCQFGGFNGRTNKLLDSCYSFWVGAIFNIVNNFYDKKISYDNHLIYSEQGLQQYIAFYCQNKEGGLWDKPGKSRDIYHTCYALSGLSQSQQLSVLNQSDKLVQNDPIYNVPMLKLQQARSHYDTA